MGTPALLRRAIARRERPPPAVGIESKSCSEFRAEEVPLLIINPPGQGQLPPWLRRTNIWLRVTSPARGAKRPRRSLPAARRLLRPEIGDGGAAVPTGTRNPRQVGDGGVLVHISVRSICAGIAALAMGVSLEFGALSPARRAHDAAFSDSLVDR